MSGRVALRDAVRDTAKKQARVALPVVRATVTALHPLTVQPHNVGYDLTLDNDFELGGWAKVYNAQGYFKVGDLALMHHEDGWVLFDVVSDITAKIASGGGGGGSAGPAGPAGPAGAAGPAGPAGPAGMPGAAGAPGSPPDSNYVYDGTGTPAATWTVTHNLGKYPAVMVVDTGNNVLVPDVRYISVNQLVISFGGATSGKAYLN